MHANKQQKKKKRKKKKKEKYIVLICLKITQMLNKQVTRSTQDRLELLGNLSDDFKRMQASTSH